MTYRFAKSFCKKQTELEDLYCSFMFPQRAISLTKTGSFNT